MAETTTVAGTSQVKGMGWLPDRPDVRDYVSTTPEVQEKLSASGSKSLQLLAERSAAVTAADGAAGALGEATGELPPTTDLREWFSDVEDQETIGSCTANAAVGIVEYYQRRTHGKNLDMSRLFVYKVTRKLLGLTGDTGAYLRSTMGALALFGTPPERYWPYDISQYEEEPPAFAYAYGDNFEALTYYRLDPSGTTPDQVLAQVKAHLAAGQPAMFGFTVYASIQRPVNPGEIPFPSSRENVLGGHAIVAAGYDDAKEIRNPVDGSVTTGAFRIRNSWGTSWGEDGYGWLPYEYVTQGLAEDWWVMTSAEWVDSSAFDE
jgi:C1A family cysteine protease